MCEITTIIRTAHPRASRIAPTGTKNVDKFTVDRNSGTISVRNLATGQHATASNGQVWQMLLAAEQAAELLVCAIDDADGDGDREGYRGLVEGHAYSIKEVSQLTSEALPRVPVNPAAGWRRNTRLVL